MSGSLRNYQVHSSRCCKTLSAARVKGNHEHTGHERTPGGIYLTFFQFLKLAVSWYQQSKLEHILHSFTENGSDQIDGTISKIRDLVNKMHREGGWQDWPRAEKSDF